MEKSLKPSGLFLLWAIVLGGEKGKERGDMESLGLRSIGKERVWMERGRSFIMEGRYSVAQTRVC